LAKRGLGTLAVHAGAMRMRGIPGSCAIGRAKPRVWLLVVAGFAAKLAGPSVSTTFSPSLPSGLLSSPRSSAKNQLPRPLSSRGASQGGEDQGHRPRKSILGFLSLSILGVLGWSSSSRAEERDDTRLLGWPSRSRENNEALRKLLLQQEPAFDLSPRSDLRSSAEGRRALGWSWGSLLLPIFNWASPGPAERRRVLVPCAPEVGALSMRSPTLGEASTAGPRPAKVPLAAEPKGGKGSQAAKDSAKPEEEEPDDGGWLGSIWNGLQAVRGAVSAAVLGSEQTEELLETARTAAQQLEKTMGKSAKEAQDAAAQLWEQRPGEREELIEEPAPLPEVLGPAPVPKVPGLQEAHCVARIDTDVRRLKLTSLQAAESMTPLMSLPAHAILKKISHPGWKVKSMDPKSGLCDLSLPEVTYQVPLGTVSMSRQNYQATVRNTGTQSADIDLVLKNGDDILTVQLGPFNFSISAIVWSRSSLGREEDEVIVSNHTEAGFPVCGIFESILSSFVKTYVTDFSDEVAKTLATAVEALALQPVDSGSAAEDVEELEEAPSPFVPGMDEANLIVCVEIPIERAEAKSQRNGVETFMAQAGGKILGSMGQDGWVVTPVDEANNLFELALPSVNYKMPLGTVSIPAPLFRTQVRDTRVRSGDYEERLQGDLILTNGTDILTVELGFPFKSTFSVSAFGWTRACIGWEGKDICVSNKIELGLKVPKVPGLEGIMRFFVKTYGAECTIQVAEALAAGTDLLAEGGPDALFGESAAQAAAASKEAEVQSAETPAEAAQVLAASATVASAAPAAAAAPVPAVENSAEASEVKAKAVPTAPASKAEATAEASPQAKTLDGDTGALDAPAPAPQVPGLDTSSIVVRVDVPRRKVAAEAMKHEGVERLMSLPGSRILANMAQEGWEVKTVDEAKNLYELSLPAVNYKMSLATVSIPPPRFRTIVRDTYARSGAFEERLQGDMILENGQDILTVELGFPFRTKFSISAAGWTRAHVGWEDEFVTVSSYIEVGLNLPSVPGIESIMQAFVQNYGTDSTQQVAAALAYSADHLQQDWFTSAFDAVAGGIETVQAALGDRAGDHPKGDHPEGEHPDGTDRAGKQPRN